MSVRARIALLAVGVLCALPVAGARAAVPTGYNPDGLPVASCFWTGPFTTANPKTNQGFPGSEITYWGAKFATPPGARLILGGEYAHARFQSLAAYVDNGTGTNSLPDYETRPDPGSVNPFIEGHRRDLPNRSYTVSVRGTTVPPHPAPNTLYAVPDPAGDSYQDILYRVYVPDRGRNRLGGEPLPTPELRLADGTVLTGGAMCEALNSNHALRRARTSRPPSTSTTSTGPARTRPPTPPAALLVREVLQPGLHAELLQDGRRARRRRPDPGRHLLQQPRRAAT